MSEQLIKPYEISVWEDELTQSGLVEHKIAIIGSDTMTGLNKVHNPVFNKKANGERTLTFSLTYRYFDPHSGEMVVNPFTELLVNERKVKLHYDGQWYEFIVKTHTETTEEFVWNYTCTDAFVLELAKNGYNITFDAELNNNQGTAAELAGKTIENTDWQLGQSDPLKQYVAEPIYKGTLMSTSGISIFDTDRGSIVPFETPAQIYVFYSYVKNQDGKFVEFIIRDSERHYVIDDDNVIHDTNYRIETELVYDADNHVFKTSQGIPIITIGDIETAYQANRLVYKQLTTYDPIMGRTVNCYKAGTNGPEVYGYDDYTYATSNVVTSFITNGENFNILEDGSLQGWNPYVEADVMPPKKLELVNWPELGVGKVLADLSTLSYIEGFLKVYFGGTLTSDYKNAIFNSGIENNVAFIESIAKGEEFVFRWRAGQGQLGQLTPVQTLGLVVAKYTQDTPTRYGYYYKHIDPDNIVLQIEGQPEVLNNVVTGGYINTEVIEGVTNYTYVIDDVVQTISTKYVYKNSRDDKLYVWNGTESIFEELDEDYSNYLPYYYLKGTAQKAIPNTILTDPTERYGVFIYTTHTDTETVDGDPTIEEVEGTVTAAPYEFTQTINPVVGTKIEVTYLGLAEEGEEGEEETEPAEYSFTCTAGTSFTDEKEGHIYHYDAETNTITCSNTNGISDYTISYTSGYQQVTQIAPIYIEDIQFTRFIPDGADSTGETPVIMGNIPTSTTVTLPHYYLKPEEGATAEEIDTYNSLAALASDIGVQETDIIPVYNENSEKILSISVSQSNCFDILQTIAETFECWIDLVVEHDDNGYITYDGSRPNKYVYLKEYAGDDNYAGFKYGINLQSIEREINSEELVTKLIVEQSQSDYMPEGFVSIASAPSNTGGESYILNFDYYYRHNLLNKEDTEQDKLDFLTDISNFNQQLKEKEQQRRELESALLKLGSDRNVFTELVETAKEEKSEALGEFENLTGRSYENYRNAQTNAITYRSKFYIKTTDTTIVAEKNYYTYNSTTGEMTLVESPSTAEINTYYEILDDFSEEDTVVDLIGTIYTTSATINNYSGILTNTEQEYWQVRKQLRGSENYNVKVWVNIDALQQRHVYVELNDYLPGFKFKIDGSTYPSTVSTKYFDIETVATEITFTAPSGYTMETTTYHIDDDKVATFKITANSKIGGLEAEIKEIQAEKDERTKEFNNKYSRFIQEGTWSSTDYIDSELYYLDALQVSTTSAQPTVSYTINVVEISELEGFEPYLFDAGEKTYVEDVEFFGYVDVDGVLTPAKESVIVSEVEWHLEEPDKNTITVQNYKTRFEDFFQRIAATVQTVQYNEATYAKIDTLLNPDGTLDAAVLVDSLNDLGGQEYNLVSNGAIVINDDAILVQNLQNPANRVMITSGGIKVSSDGGNSWKMAVDGQGINIGAVYTGSLNTNEVFIGNKNNPSFRWDKSGISAYKNNEHTYVKTSDTSINPLKQYYTYNAETNSYSVVENPIVEDIDTYYEDSSVYNLQTYVRYDQYGLYGIKNDTFKAESLNDILDKAHFAVTWDGFFIKNNYEGGGRVEITSDNDFRVLNTVNEQENEKIKIGALEWMVPTKDTTIDSSKTYYKNEGGQYVIVNTPDVAELSSYYELSYEPVEGVAPSLYGIRIKNNQGVEVMKTDDNGDLTIIGTIDATAANFGQEMTVGKNSSQTSQWITIDGRTAEIYSSDYKTLGTGWIIDKEGNAVFNNISARGSIKTAVFEYAEIQAVGGIFLFRPSSTIKSVIQNGGDLILTLEKPLLFAEGDWCKISNYTTNGEATDPSGTIIQNNGLNHIYQISDISSQEGKVFITLQDAAQVLNATSQAELIGGALVNMGKDPDDSHYESGIHNYGIGINSSDNTVDLPARAISLFETNIIKSDPPAAIKVNYDYTGILGTLPPLNLAPSDEDNIYDDIMVGSQGIYTNNMYIGNKDQYIAFYQNGNDKQLSIKAQDVEIKGGTAEQNGFLYLSTHDYGTSLSINGYSTNTWREVIGTKFGVTSDGSLYANSATISGVITADTLNLSASAEDTINDTVDRDVVIIEIVSINYAKSTATLQAKLKVNGAELPSTTQRTYNWTMNNDATIIGDTSSITVTDLDAIYNCTITW